MKTTVVGNYPKIPNLPRPAKFRKAIADFDAGKITRAELERITDQVTVEVLDEQADAGIDLVTDGKIRWEDEQTYLARGLQGFSISGLLRYFDSNTYYRQPVCEGAVRWTQPITVRDFQFAQENSAKPIKVALTGPYTLARLSLNQHYATLDEFVLALADALNAEARALEQAGATFIQFDEPAILRHKQDWALFEQAMRRLTQGLTAKLALYTYFGDVSGIYPQILDLPFAVLGLDFVQGPKNWDVIKTAPFTKELGFGIVNARNTKIETKKELQRAFARIARFVALDRVYINPTCGLEFLPRERAQEKLANMVAAVGAAGSRDTKRGNTKTAKRGSAKRESAKRGSAKKIGAKKPAQSAKKSKGAKAKK